MIGGDLELLDAYFLVPMDSSEAKEKLLDSRKTSDDLIRRAQAKIGISGVRCDHQQFLGIRIRLADHFQAVKLTLIDQAGVDRLHPHA